MAAISISPLQSNTSQPNPQSNYIIGQSKHIHNILSHRTAQNSAAFLLPHIKPADKILDVGCGPGSITLDFAALVPQGSATGLDASEEAIKTCRLSAKERAVENIEFLVSDAGKLPFDDNTFDVIYSHQVLLHNPDPVAIIREIRRILKPGGYYASREADITTLKLSPDIPACRKTFELFHQVLAMQGSNPRGGYFSQDWCAEAGFERAKMEKTWSWMVQHTGKAGGPTVGNIMGAEGTMVKSLIEHGMVSEEEIREIEDAWNAFDRADEGEKSLSLHCGEVLCIK